VARFLWTTVYITVLKAEWLSGLWNYIRTFFTFFNVFFKIKKHDFLRIFELLYTFSRVGGISENSSTAWNNKQKNNIKNMDHVSLSLPRRSVINSRFQRSPPVSDVISELLGFIPRTNMLLKSARLFECNKVWRVMLAECVEYWHQVIYIGYRPNKLHR